MNTTIYTISDNDLISKVRFCHIPVILSCVAVVPSEATKDETDLCDVDSTVSFVVASVAAQKFSTNTQHCYEMYTKSGSPQKLSVRNERKLNRYSELIAMTASN